MSVRKWTPSEDPKPQENLHEALINIRRNLQEMLEFQTVIAEIRWHSFNEHIKAGFTEAQAINLCKRIKL